MRIISIIAISGIGLSACTPAAPKMDVAQAQVHCRTVVSKPVDTRVQIGVGVGSGGKTRAHTGVSVGVDLTSLLTPEKSYENCVKQNAGVEPTEPYAKTL